MINVNIVYDDDTEDVDIIAVPDNIANDIDNITQLFFNWLKDKRNQQRFLIKNAQGKEILSIDTNDFIWWLNTHYMDTLETAYLVSQHTSLCSEYPTTVF